MVSEAEKARISPSLQSVTQEELGDQTPLNAHHRSRYQRWAGNIKGLEARGIERIPVEERLKANPSISLHMLLMWFSMGMSLNNMVVGSMGTLVMKLSFADAALCAIFGNLLGGLTVGYMSTWGPRSGNRTLIVTRYFMGYYPSKICCLLNVLTNLGYGMMNCMIGGQLLSKISGGSVSVAVGIIIVALASLVMATFGMQIFQYYERYAWFPQLMVLCIITGSAGPQFDFQSPSVGSSGEVNAKRLAFFSLCLSVALSWAPLAADYYVYYPPTIRKWKIWSMTTIGGCLAMIITLLLGVGLGSGVANNPRWAAIYDGTPGSLLMAGYGRLGGFGRFCAFINVVTVVSNNAPGSYSMAMNFQMLGHVWSNIPRPVFTITTTVVYTACAIGGRDFLYEIFKSFLPLIGYWVVIWFTIVAEEDLLFRHGGYDWSAWNCRQKLPVGVAAGLAFLVGWAGAIVGMDQVYYTGPVANAVTGGCDLGIWLGFGFTALAFPPLRMLELRVISR
ncbi:hypothetical protein ETB97_007611 [Aspergillus alliaceus]|uniref:Purine-cytosine permease n=1 Tax=Petromyces alliaceus TaxID=209559 RepID=A0A5N7CJG7_PETAA|nr:uncharacterized protein BDW43DRAFT_319192 [Aspergillus alliaceus]KAB8238919.1 hypothetical protein BDW43DRAFT_319192 [Aspergillus alliaceus]KAE8394255.1 hypothetical protein BDV23DRAFT_190412 [Aspergillus alliaceus]KAF5864506.1 hypothetical protein ETB97_007611 [Aspergillus burnettii]